MKLKRCNYKINEDALLEVSAKTNGFTGADIDSMVNEAVYISLRNVHDF